MNISVIIPAFNESKRLPLYLTRLIDYSKQNKKISEIIIVDDGSSDNTSAEASLYASKFNNLRIIKLKKNRGKGYAVKAGMLESKGDICVFLDADGSVPPEEIGRNEHYLTEEGYDILIGSRVLKEKGQSLKFRWHRKVIGVVFNFLVQAILFKKISDTQCGFKMFKKETIEPLFSRVYLEGFGFDIELLYLAYKMGYKIKETAISWHHVRGSKVNILTDSIKMFFNILQVRNWHCTPINPFSKYLGPDEHRYMYEMESEHWWFVSRRDFILSLIRFINKSYPVILDIGCGTGLNLSEFKNVGRAYGFDISKDAVGFCHKRGTLNVVQASASDICFGEKVFDIVTLLDVMEHLPYQKAAFEEVRRVLKDNGKLIITVPAFKILWSQHDEALCHFRRYERSELIKELIESGYRIEKIGYFFFSSFLAVALIRIIRKLRVSKNSCHSDTTTAPPKLINRFLIYLFRIERRISFKINMPFGTTLYAVASKKELP